MLSYGTICEMGGGGGGVWEREISAEAGGSCAIVGGKCMESRGGENFGLPIYLNNNSIYLICLICLSSAGMQKLLNVCSKYAT